MVALLLPWVTLDKFELGPFTVSTFAVLIGIGALTGFWIAVRRAEQVGISRERVAQFSLFMIVGAMIGARYGSVLYEPNLSGKDAIEIFVRYHGISSFGLYGGGFIGALLFFRLRCKSIRESLQYLDAIGFALPFLSFLGRLGCALVHDHPGIRGDGWLAVDFPDGARYDLGLLEAMFLFLLAAVYLSLARRRWPAGSFFALYACTYGVFRLLLDQLHENPTRHFGFTVDQFGAALTIVAGVVTFYLSGSTHTQHSTPEKTHGPSVRPVSKP